MLTFNFWNRPIILTTPVGIIMPRSQITLGTCKISEKGQPVVAARGDPASIISAEP